jgi:hypothetical protein
MDHQPMHRSIWIFTVVLVLLRFLSPEYISAGEVFVDGKAPPGGVGTAASPYDTLGVALKAAGPSTTITIKGGVYRESVQITKGGDEQAPLVIRAAAGERVEVTGFDAILGWKMEGKLAKATVKAPVYDLCVGGARQPIARFPDKMSPWTGVTAAEGSRVKVDLLPPVLPENIRGLCLAMLLKDFNSNWSFPVTRVDEATKTVELAALKTHKVQAGDSFVYYNSPSFIKYPGDWSCQPVKDGYEVIFWPKNPKDLEKTQFRRRENVIRLNKVGNVTLQGLEITGAIHTGIFAVNCSNLKIERCMVYHNGLPDATSPNGIYMDGSDDSLVDSSIIFANYRGLGICQGKDNVIKGCEIALNDGDGVNLIGRRSAKDKPALRPILTRCYLYGQIYQGHADNLQTWGWVNDTEYSHNLSIMSAQHMMLENTSRLKAHHSILFSSIARLVILGGRYCSDSSFENMLFLWGNLGSIGLSEDSAGMKIRKNVFYANPLNYEGSKPVTGDSLFWSPKPDVGLITKRDENNKFQSFKNVADLAAMGFETGSQQADPGFKNIPQAHGISNAPKENTPDKLRFHRPGSLVGFSVGDTIEINFDHVPRTIESLTEDTMIFKPALAAAPFRDVVVWGWGKRSDLQLDFTSPLAGGADQPGVAINVMAYQRGELDGSGKRSIPVMSEEGKAALPDPSAYLFPYALPLSYSKSD